MQNRIIKSELRKTICRRDAIILLVLGLWPILVTVCCRLGTGIFDFSGDPIGAFEFTSLLLSFQDMIFLPVLVGVYIASMSFYQEIHNKQIYLYKDIKRASILNAKYISIYAIYFIFVAVYILLSFLFYFLMFKYEEIATGTLLADPENVIPLLYEAAQVILGMLFYIHIGITFSIRTSTGFSIFATTFVYMLALVTPYLKNFRYLFPIGYKEVIQFPHNSYGISLALSVLVWTVYNITLYLINRKHFNHMEFN